MFIPKVIWTFFKKITIVTKQDGEGFFFKIKLLKISLFSKNVVLLEKYFPIITIIKNILSNTSKITD